MKVSFISALLPIAMLSLLNSVLLHQPANNNTVTIEATDPTPRTFKSPDGSFQFTYPNSYAVYTGDEAEDAGRRLSYIAVCENALVCVVYPESKYKGTNFEAASFQVREVDDAKSAKACLTPRVSAPNASDFSVDSEKPKRTIDGVLFLHGVRGEGGLGHSMSTDIYRAFHNGSCYELSVNLAVTSFGAFDPGTIQEFKDASRVRDELLKVADSFRFLK